MSNKPKAGDKYVIEIEGVYGKQITVPAGAGVYSMDIPFNPVGPSTLYMIKGFPSFVFTEEDLKKLEKYEEKDERPADAEVKVGDEVITKYGSHVVVTRVSEKAGYYSGLDKDGALYTGVLRNAQRTGFKFPGIESAIAHMRRIDVEHGDEIELGF